MNDRREEILKIALKLFNEKGIDKVKTRDIAKATNISLGNLTYYFPTKSDIVLALTEEVVGTINEALSRIETGKDNSSLVLYYQEVHVIFAAQLKYKFLFKRYGDIITSFPKIQKMLQELLKGRFRYWDHLNIRMYEEGLVTKELVEDGNSQSYLINILALFWHQEFAIYFPGLKAEEKITKALAIYFQSYKPYLTTKGRGELLPLLEKLEVYS